MSVLIRLYTLADTPKIMDLFHDTVHAINSRDYTREQVDAWAPHDMDRQLWAESLGRSLTRNHTYVAVAGEIIVGFGDYEDTGHLDRFYVHKDYQGQGVGRLLITSLEDAAKARGITRLFTEASITAKPFFLKHGYTIIQEQQVQHNGAVFTNYQMEKVLTQDLRRS